MKKINKLFLVLALALSTNFATAKGGAGLEILLIPAAIGAGLALSVPLAATPYLFKDNTTDYSYLTTFRYVAISTLVIPPITLLTTKDYRAFAASIVLASIGGTIVGFNVSKTKRASTGKKGLYVGIGVGYSVFSSEHDFRLPMEIGYGITENLLISLPLEIINRTKNSVAGIVNGIGVSYYMRNDRYIKIMLGGASISIPDDARHNLRASTDSSYKSDLSIYKAASIGYGYPVFKRLAVEINYINLQLDSDINTPLDTPSNINMFNVSLNYRWL